MKDRKQNNGHDHNHDTMPAVVWEGKPFKISIEDVRIPSIMKPTDAIIRCTSSGICGSDLHIFHGRYPAKAPMTMGHEIVGIVHEIGSNVTELKVGDRVIVSGIVFGSGLDGADEEIGGLGIGNPPGFEQFNGGQAEFVRVIFAQENCLLLPPGNELEKEYVLLADIFPTAMFALDLAGFVFGDVVVVFGAGPVGLLCAYSALLRGASKVYSVDRVAQRLAKAKSIGAIPIDFSDGDPVAQILKHEPLGVDRSCDCVGYECVNAEGVNVGNTVLVQCINVTRIDGGIGVVGLYMPQDAGAASAAERQGIFSLPVGTWWLKGQSIKGGVVPLREYQPQLKKLIESGRAKPSFVIDTELRIEEAAAAYKQFSDQNFIKSFISFDHKHHSKVDAEEEVENERRTEKRKRV